LRALQYEGPHLSSENRFQTRVGAYVVVIHWTPSLSYTRGTMRVSQLPPVLSPGRVYDLLLSGALLPGLAVEPGESTGAVSVGAAASAEAAASGGHPDRRRNGRPTGSRAAGITCAVVLVGSEDEPVVPVTASQGGFARLVAHIVRAGRVEAQRAADGTHLVVTLPPAAAEWIADRSVLWVFLAGGWGIPQGAGGVHPPQRVDSSEALSIAAETPTWVVRVHTAGSSGTVVLSWLVVESNGTGGSSQPSRIVAAGIQRMRDLLSALGGEVTVSVRRQEPSAIPGGRSMMRLESSAARVYWPLRSFRGIISLLAGGDSQLHALQRLLDIELTGYGMLRLLQTVPRTPETRRSRPALRTVQELIRAGGGPQRSLADTSYRNGATYQAAAVLSAWLSPGQRDQLRRTFGHRRWEQISEHGLRRVPAAPDGSAGVLPGNAVAAAADILVADLAQRSHQPGRRPPAATVEVVRRFYIEPRGSRLRAVWERQIRRGVLADLLEEVFLSQLKRDLPRVPRETLVLSAVGEPQAVRERIGAVFSRRGRALFTEDVAAAEASVARGDFTDWDRILAARNTLWGIYSRSGPSHGGRQSAGRDKSGRARSRSSIGPA
ncbi:MAG: hypothetical protein ACOCYB_12790, partial [Alkalispirochaeta sp.]